MAGTLDVFLRSDMRQSPARHRSTRPPLRTDRTSRAAGFGVFLLLAAVTSVLHGQYFGRNKVQYEDFDFRVLGTSHFDVHFYARENRVLLWPRCARGYVVAAVASIQGALYLLVLAINSAVAIRRGLVEAPGELPAWGMLAVTTAAAALLLTNVRGERRERP